MNRPAKALFEVFDGLAGELVHEVEAEIMKAHPIRTLHGCFCFFGGVPAADGRKKMVMLFLDTDGNAVHAGAHGILEIVLTHIAGIHLHGDLCRVRNAEMLRERLHQSCELRFGERRGGAAPQIDGIAEAILKVRAFEIHFLGKCINVAVGGLSSNRIEAAVITTASAKGIWI